MFGARRVQSFAAECGLRWPGAHRGSGGTTIFLSERVELQASFSALLARTSLIELPDPPRRRPEFVIRGLAELPIVLHR